MEETELKQADIEEGGYEWGILERIGNARHNIHTSRDFQETTNTGMEMMCAYRTLASQFKELPKLDIYFPDYVECENEDCDGVCPQCEEAEAEWIKDNKEDINSKIEEWMIEVEEYFGIEEYCPSGMNRMRWAENV